MTTTTVTLDTFLADLRARHGQRLPKDTPYEAMMYRAENPPTHASLQALAGYIEAERPDSATVPPIPDDDATLQALGKVFAQMRWPDAQPLASAASRLPQWDTLHVTTLLHAIIPDYPILGPHEVQGLAKLGIRAEYIAEPTGAVAAYATYMQHVKHLREAARFDQVPESHHYLTRIVQAALEDLADA